MRINYANLFAFYFSLIASVTAMADTNCTYSLSPSSVSYGGGQTNNTIAVTASGSCYWAASSSDPSWINTGYFSYGNGNGTAYYTVYQNNTGSSRTGTITIGDQVFTINQSACGYSLSPSSVSYGGGQTNSTIAVTASGSCYWAASSSDPSWINTGYFSYGNGNGIAYYTVYQNNTGSSRTGTITIGDQVFTIRQLPIRQLSNLYYFGIGVDWFSTNCVRGDIDAISLKNHLQSNLPTFDYGTVVPLSADDSGTVNANKIFTQWDQFKTMVGPNDTVIFYVSTHGGKIELPDGNTDAELQISDDSTSDLTGEIIATLLKSLPSSTRKIVILDTCHAGAAAPQLKDVSNISLLAASGPDDTADADPYDCTGLFTDKLIADLDKGIYDIRQIVNDMPGAFTNYFGQYLVLKDSGSAIFTGLKPQLYEKAGFKGDLLGPVTLTNQISPRLFNARVVTNSLCFSVTNVPAQGNIVVESSTDFAMWLQVAFTNASGTNLNYSFPMTNNAAMFFRAQIIP
jgi:hypothetical protein